MTVTVLGAGGGHVAVLDVLAGVGVLAQPLPANDVLLASVRSQSLHESDWNATMDLLDLHGWEPAEDETGCPMSAGRLPDGRGALMLRGPGGDEQTDESILSSLLTCMDEVAGS